MTRRTFLGTLAAAASQPQSIQIKIETRTKLGAIPKDFLGLGYEISSVSKPGLLSAANHAYVRLVGALSPAGIIRIGGITADYASFAPNAQPVSSPKASVVNRTNLAELASFLKATNWKLIWNLNLGTGSINDAVTEAEAVSAEIKQNLLAFEIGNEPDIFNRGSSAHRPSTYGYAEWLAEYRKFKAAIRAKLPNATFAGPDAATDTDWVTHFANDEGNDIKLLTHHYYRECASATSTLDKLLKPDPRLQPLLDKLRAATRQSNVPYRICETNSFCGGGKQGVSDTFGAALWALDFLWKLADAGCAGVNIETGVNQLDFVSWYSPITANTAKPEYYGMLAFAQSVGGERVSVTTSNTNLNLSTYAATRDNATYVTIINKDTQSATVSLALDRPIKSIHAMRLQAPSLESTQSVTFGPAVQSANQIEIPVASAAVLSLSWC
jgi:hypothetical protein